MLFVVEQVLIKLKSSDFLRPQQIVLLDLLCFCVRATSISNCNFINYEFLSFFD